tara:strand:- start:5280 stop:8849 length:3570 start_codon:yes stop_codon:yes gene_type:complete
MASRTGSARVFFEVVGSFQAEKLLKDTQATSTVMQAIMLDAFGGVFESIQFAFEGISDLFKEQIDSFYEFEEQMIQVRKFYQGSEEDVQFFADASKHLGETFAFSGSEALKAAANMAQMQTVLGSKQAVIAGTEMGLLFAEIGNMETQEAMKKLTSLMQQTGFAMGGLTKAQYDSLDAQEQANVVRGNTMRVLDQLNTIENSSVATMQDMTFVLNQFAAQGNLAGETMGSMGALAAMLLEAGEETSRAGTGLRMMFSRIAVDGGDASEALAKVIPELDAQTISMMSLTEIIKALTPHYKELDNIEKIRLTQAVAGNRHYVKLQKLLENHDRLLQMNEMAYAGNYSAAEEFNNRQESMVFQIDRANAAIENQRVEVGENLAEAYVRSLAPQYYFLQGLEKITDESSEFMGIAYGGKMNTAISNIMFMAETMQQLEVPINFAMGLGNIFISMKTMSVLLKQMTQQEKAHTEAFHRRIFIQEQSAALANKFTHKQIRDIKEVQQAELKALDKSIAGMNAKRAAAIKANRQQESNIARIIEEHRAIGALDTTAKVQKSNAMMLDVEARRVQMTNHNNTIRMMESEILYIRNIRAMKADYQVNQLNYFMMESGYRAQQQKDQKNFMGHIQREADYLSKHIVIFRELTEVELEQLGVKINDINVSMRRQHLMLSEARLRLQLGTLTEEETIALEEEIATREKHISSMGRELAGIEGLINANGQLKARTDEVTRALGGLSTYMAKHKGDLSSSAIAVKYFGDAWNQARYNMFIAEGAFKSTMSTIQLGMSSVLGLMMLFTDNTDLLSAAMIGLALANGIGAAATWAYAAAADGATLSTILMQAAATSGLSLIAAGAALAAGYVLWETFKPDKNFEDSMSAITDLDNGLGDLQSTMTDLSKKGDVTIDTILGDTTYNQLRNSATMAADAVGLIAEKQDELNAAILDTDTYSDAEIKALQTKLGYYEQIGKEVGTINDAHMSLNKTIQRETTAASTYTASERSRDWTYEMMTNPENFISQLNSGVMMHQASMFQAGLLKDEELNQYLEMYGKFGKQIGYYITGIDTVYETAEERNEVMNAMNQALLTDAESVGDNIKEFYEGILVNVGEAATTMTSDVGAALSEVGEFANAREELFFGNQANFQGSVYKQITQGGVESLLHRVEIMQTNVFNGVTIEEAIDRVSDGVMMNLRAQGVPI